MGRGRRILFSTLFVAAVMALGWVAFFLKEPAYQGKKLSFWLEGYNPIATNGLTWDMADQAVRGLGARAIPTLLKLVRQNDPAWKLKAIEWAQKHRLMKDTNSVPARIRNFQGLYGFQALGAGASNAVPELLRICEQCRSPASQRAAVMALGAIGSPAGWRAVPVLLNAATNGDPLVRLNALAALRGAQAGPAVLVPALMRGAQDSDTHVKQNSIYWLMALGADAKPAVSMLIKLLGDSDKNTRSLAEAALKHIEPEAAGGSPPDGRK